MTDAMMDLRSLIEKSPDADILRKMIGFACQGLMELEVGARTGAPYGEKSAGRGASGGHVSRAQVPALSTAAYWLCRVIRPSGSVTHPVGHKDMQIAKNFRSFVAGSMSSPISMLLGKKPLEFFSLARENAADAPTRSRRSQECPVTFEEIPKPYELPETDRNNRQKPNVRPGERTNFNCAGIK